MPTQKQLEQQYIEDRAFFGSVGARWRGLAGGALLGSFFGAMTATAGLGIFALATQTPLSSIPATMGKEALIGIIGLFTGSGLLIGSNLWGGAGQVSGAVSAGLMAKKDLEEAKAKGISLSSEKEQASNPPLINWKVVALGAGIMAAIGATLATFNVLPASYLMLGQEAGTPLGAAAAAATLGAFGGVFGVSFKAWQAVKSWTDGFFEGKVDGRAAPGIVKLREMVTAPVPEASTHITVGPFVAASERQVSFEQALQKKRAENCGCEHQLS